MAATSVDRLAGVVDPVREAIANADLLRLYGYWLARCTDDRLPARRDVDPVDLPYVVGDLVLIDVLRDPLRFRYRLIGGNPARRVKVSLAGKMVDEHPDPTLRRLAIEACTTVATTRRPLAYRRDQIIDDRVRRYDVLILPLAGDGVTVDMLLIGMK